jgi:hypothetical protein
MPFDGSCFKPQTRYTSFVDGRSFPSMGMRDLYDTGRRSHDSMARSQEPARRSEEPMTRGQQEADRFMRSMSQHANQTQYSCSSPPLTLSLGTGGVGSAVGAVVRLAVLAVVVAYALPHVLRPAPPVILSAQEFVTANLESAAAELVPPDVARSIDTFIGAMSR